MAVYNQMATFGANLERGRGFFESWGRGLLAGYATAISPIGGGAASAALVGGSPGRGALMGLVQTATAVVGGSLGVPANDFVAVAQSAAIGAAGGAAGAAIVGGDPLKGAAYGAASAAAVTVAFRVASALMRSGRFQEGLDVAQKQKGQEAVGGTVDTLGRTQPRESVRGRFGLAYELGGVDAALMEVQALSADMAPRVEPIKWTNPLTPEQVREFWWSTAKLTIELYAQSRGAETHDLSIKEFQDLLEGSNRN